MRMRMTSPLATERSTDPVVSTPRKPVFPPEFHRMDGQEKTSAFVAMSHLAHLPVSSSTCQTWKSRNINSTLVPSCISTCRGHAKLPMEIVLQATSPKQHLKRNRFVCPEVHCDKHFPRSFALRRHMRIHTGTKPYACDYHGCLQRFNTSGNLSRHKRIHSGERPYPCDFKTCNKRFNTSTKLKRHLRIHFPDGQNLFRCTEHACAWACDNYKEYVQHQKLHRSVDESCSDAINEPIVTTNDISSDDVRFKQDKTTCSKSAPITVVQSRPESRTVENSVEMSLLAVHEDSYEHICDRMYAGMAAIDSSTTQRMMQESMPHQIEDSSICRMGRTSVLRHKSFLEDLTSSQSVLRLPFPTSAIPSETTGMYGSSFLRSSLPPAPTLAHRCYDSAVPSRQVEMATSSNPNYTLVSTYDFIQGPCSSNRHGGETDVHASSYQPTSTTTTTFMAMSEQQYTQDVGQEIMDRQYARSAPHSGRQQPSLRSQPSYSRNPVPPDFTGEELSAVLELVKDS